MGSARRFRDGILRLTVIFVATLLLAASCAEKPARTSKANAAAPASFVREDQLLNSSTGWVLSDSALAITSDGGATWSNMTPPGVDPSSIQGVFFLDAQHAWLAAYRPGATDPTVADLRVYRTSDAGQTWSSTVVNSSADYQGVNQITAYLDFITTNVGWVEAFTSSSSNGPAADLFRTTDGGSSWTKKSIPVGGPIAFVTEMDGWVTAGLPNGSLDVTHNGGQSWNSETLQPPAGFQSAQSIPEIPAFSTASPVAITSTFIQGDSNILALYKTADKGASWTLAGTASMGTPAGQVADPISTVAGGSYVAANLDGATVEDLTADGNVSKSVTTSGVPSRDGIDRVSFTSSFVGWALVLSGSCSGFKTGCQQTSIVFQTTDAGKTWTQLNTP